MCSRINSLFRDSNLFCANQHGKYVTIFNIESLQNESTRKLYEERLALKCDQNKILYDDDVDESWEKLKKNIKSAAQEAIGTRKTIINKSECKVKSTPWFCEEVRVLAEEKKRAYLIHRSKQTDRSKEEYKEVRNGVNSEIKRIKQQYWEKFSKELEFDFFGLQRQVWKTIRNQKRETREFIESSKISAQQWTSYFTLLFQNDECEEENGEGGRETELEEGNEPTMHITLTELEESLIKLRNRKSTGLDGINNELLKYGGESMRNELYSLLNKILRDRKVPKEWKTAILVPIFKKGDKKEPNNYRGINLLNTSLKLTTKIITEKLSSLTEHQEEQQGFRKGRSCTDAIFVVRQIVEKALEFNRPAFMCLIDLQKAFDRIRLSDMTEILARREIPTSLIQLIKDIYTGSYIKVRCNGEMSQSIPAGRGVRQGDSLSPMLFNFMMDEIIEAVKGMRGYRMSGNNINIICYADDAILIAENEDDLQRLLFKFNNICKQYNMKISTEKTKALTIARDPIRCKLVVDNDIIEQVMEVKYLGMVITSSGDIDRETNEQITKTNRIAGCMNGVIWNNKYLRSDTKARIYKSVLRPILTYGTEVRQETAGTRRRIQATEMRVLRRIAKKTRWDRVRNENIRETCQVTDIAIWTRERRQNWEDHVSRMSSERLPKIARDSRPFGRRRAGRPRKRWRDSL